MLEDLVVFAGWALLVDLVAEDFEGDLQRLTGLGASVLSTSTTPAGTPSAVLADPEGNEFCVS